MNKRKIGDAGEALAIEYLGSRGYDVLDRNYYTKYGEIDIVAVKDRLLHFVEVKTRTSDIFGCPSEAVDDRKQVHLLRAARIYIEDKRIINYNCCFDVIEIQLGLIENCI